MWVLAVETSTQMGSVTIMNADGKNALRESLRQKSHSEFVHPAIQECLKELKISLNQIDILAVGRGPGSFTGIRVAGNTVKSLAWVLKKPLVSFDSLSILAHGQAMTERPLYCMVNAYRNSIYFAAFKADLNTRQWQLTSEPKALSPTEVEEQILNPGIVLGDGFGAYRDFFSDQTKKMLKEQAEEKNFPRSTSLAKMLLALSSLPAKANWESFSPLYLRSTDSLFLKQRS